MVFQGPRLSYEHAQRRINSRKTQQTAVSSDMFLIFQTWHDAMPAVAWLQVTLNLPAVSTLRNFPDPLFCF